MNYSAFLQLHDELSLLAVIVILLIYDIFAGEKAMRHFQPLAVLLLTAHTALTCWPRAPFEVAGGMYQYVPMLTYVKLILNLGTIIVFLQANEWLQSAESNIRKGEFYFLTLCTLLGMYFMMSAGHFLIFFIGIETASIPMATLVAFNKYNRESAEAGAKYILSAVFASGISLFGMSLIYGATGTLYFNDLSILLTGGPLQLMAMVFFMVGLLFKISVVPFHFWTPDVYQGAPTSVTSYLSVISKGSAIYILFAIFIKVFVNMVAEWQSILYVLIILSITIANLFALRQQNIKRFLAFSSVSQAGYLLLAVISGSAIGMSAMVYYVLVYMFSNLAIFGVVQAIETRSGKLNISDYNGLYQTNPKLSVVMMLALFSLAGIPPFAGFFSKFFIFTAAFEQGFYVLVFIALVNTIISLYYYLIVVKAMFLTKSEEPIAAFQSHSPMKISLVICTVAILVLGLMNVFFTKIAAFGFGLM